MLEEGQKRFAVRLLVERARTVCRRDRRRRSGNPIKVLDFGGHIEVALRAKEESIARASDTTDWTQVRVELRVRFASAEAEIARATFRIEPERGRNGLEQRRFAGAVLANEERDRLRKSEALQVARRPATRRDTD